MLAWSVSPRLGEHAKERVLALFTTDLDYLADLQKCVTRGVKVEKRLVRPADLAIS